MTSKKEEQTYVFHGNDILNNSLAHIKKEMAFYEATHECTKNAYNIEIPRWFHFTFFSETWCC